MFQTVLFINYTNLFCLIDKTYKLILILLSAYQLLLIIILDCWYVFYTVYSEKYLVLKILQIL